MDRILIKQINILFCVLFLLMAPCNISAQKKEISAAEDLLKKNKDLEKVQKSMENLLKDSNNLGKTKIHALLFESLQKQYLQGNEKLYLKQNYDTTSLFNIARQLFIRGEIIDSLENQPVKKGKIKIKYRKDNSQFLNLIRPNLFNAGIFYIRKKDYRQAYDFFNIYIECANQPLFREYKYPHRDKKLPNAAYWAVYCAFKQNDIHGTLRHAYWALQDTAHNSFMLQYLAETYRLEHDTLRYFNSLKEGFEKYPTFPFFFPRLVEYYVNTEHQDSAMMVVNKALRIKPNDQMYRFTKSTLMLNMNKYDECISICDSLIAENDSLAGAYYNAGLAYFDQAVKLDKKNQINSKNKNKMFDLYRRSMPYLQKFRALCPEDKNKWALPLYTIYLKLNMGKEFDEIDQILRDNK